MLNLILGRAGTGKTQTVLSRLCAQGSERPQVLLVPEQQSHEAERTLCRAGGSGVSLFAEVLSFSRLANRVFLEAGGLGRKELDAGGRILLMHLAVKSVPHRLTALAGATLQPRFLQSLLETADELKSCRVSPAALEEAGEMRGGPEGDKLRDLALICGTYDALAAQTALDPRDRLTRVAETLKDCPWGAGKDFWLDGFTDFTPQQMEVLRHLLRQGRQVTVTLACDGLEEGEELFDPARKTAFRLRRLAGQLGLSCRVEVLARREGARPLALEHMERTLFSAAPPEPREDWAGVEVFAALTPRAEVEWTAAQILELVRREGYRFREIGVAAGSFDAYSHLIQSVFSRYGIPVFCTRMSDILEKPVLSLVVGAMDAAVGGYGYEDMFRWLKTGLAGLADEEIDLLENYVLLWDLRGSRWTQEAPWAMHPRGYGLATEPEDELLLARLDDLRRRVAAPLERLRKNPEKTGIGQAKALYRFLEEIDLPGQLELRRAGLEARGEGALAEEYRQLWEILCGGLEQCAALLGDTPMEGEEFSALLRLVLSQYEVGSIPVALDQVVAGPAARLAEHRVSALFLLGAEDGAMPLVGGQKGLLSDDDRCLLGELGLELGQTGEERLSREMTTLYRVCALPDRRLGVSWPLRGGQGEELRPSFLVERLRRLFPGLPVIREESQHGRFRLAAPLPALEAAGHNREVLSALKHLPDYAEAAARIETAGRWARGGLTPATAARLYGQRVSLSASRMDRLRACHFSYFLQYGLKARPRRPAGFSAPEYGVFLHFVLERVLDRGENLLEAGAPAAPLGQEERKRLHRMVDEAVEEYVREVLGGLEGQTRRFRYLFRRLLRGVREVAEDVVDELRASRFRPLAFELGFGTKGGLPPVEFSAHGLKLSVTGVVDRVDGWEKDGKLYLRVMDYKTGKKTFDLTEVHSGMGLQMLLYLFALGERGEELFHRPVEPAGVLYLPAREVTVKGSRTMDDDQVRRAQSRELKRQGLVLDDPAVVDAMEMPGEDGYRFLPLKTAKTADGPTGEALASADRFGVLQRHVGRILGEIAQEVAQGNVAADPFWRGAEKNACQYCDYVAACHFEEGRGGDCRRWLAQLSAGEFWARLETEGEGPEPAEEGGG